MADMRAISTPVKPLQAETRTRSFSRPRQRPVSVRCGVHVRMIEEYGRRNGHADLLRERIDGATGYWPAHHRWLGFRAAARERGWPGMWPLLRTSMIPSARLP